jgi:hypothetical protein
MRRCGNKRTPFVGPMAPPRRTILAISIPPNVVIRARITTDRVLPFRAVRIARGNGQIGAFLPTRRVVSHRLQSAETSHSRICERVPRFDPNFPFAASETSASGDPTPTLWAAWGGSDYGAQACDWHRILLERLNGLPPRCRILAAVTLSLRCDRS